MGETKKSHWQPWTGSVTNVIDLNFYILSPFVSFSVGSVRTLSKVQKLQKKWHELVKLWRSLFTLY